MYILYIIVRKALRQNVLLYASAHLCLLPYPKRHIPPQFSRVSAWVLVNREERERAGPKCHPSGLSIQKHWRRGRLGIGLPEVMGFYYKWDWFHAVELPFCMGSWLLLTLSKSRKKNQSLVFQSCFFELVCIRTFKEVDIWAGEFGIFSNFGFSAVSLVFACGFGGGMKLNVNALLLHP